MTTTITHPEQGEDFTTSEGLRHVLVRLHEAGPASWEHDPTAGALVAFAADKYAGLARKHGLDPWEAASAAFEAMRNESTRTARDPWAVVTRAVQITCVAEERGQGLLCSTHQARRRKYEDVHDPERMSDRRPHYRTTTRPSTSTTTSTTPTPRMTVTARSHRPRSSRP
jgi:hypothetical protein